MDDDKFTYLVLENWRLIRALEMWSKKRRL